MSVRSIILIAFLGLLLLFALLNWSVFVTPSHLSLLVTTVDAPLGLVMLAFTAMLAAVLLSYALKVQVNALSDGRKQAAELRKQRELADQAEASRFMELRKFLEVEMNSLRQSQDAAEARLRAELGTATNTLAACIGEIDERMERQSPTPPAQQP